MLKVSTWNRNGLFMSLLEVSTRKPIMVFYYKTTKGFVSRTVWENPLRFNFEAFITFSVDLLEGSEYVTDFSNFLAVQFFFIIL